MTKVQEESVKEPKKLAILRGVLRWLSFPFSHKDDKSWTESLQHLVVAVGVIISGFWAYHTFEVLHEKDKAEADLETAKSQLEKISLELDQLRTLIDANISTNIKLSSQDFEKDGKIGLIIEATIRNTGSRPLTMTWDKTPFQIHSVAYRDEIQASRRVYRPDVYQSLTKGNIKSVAELYLLVGAEKTLSSYIELDSCGLYLIMFKAQPDSQTSEQGKKVNDKDGLWFASKYKVIDSNDICSALDS